MKNSRNLAKIIITFLLTILVVLISMQVFINNPSKSNVVQNTAMVCYDNSISLSEVKSGETITTLTDPKSYTENSRIINTTNNKLGKSILIVFIVILSISLVVIIFFPKKTSHDDYVDATAKDSKKAHRAEMKKNKRKSKNNKKVDLDSNHQ